MKEMWRTFCYIPRAVMIPVKYPLHISGTKLQAARWTMVRYVSIITEFSVKIWAMCFPITANVKQEVRITKEAIKFETLMYYLALKMLLEPMQWPTHIYTPCLNPIVIMKMQELMFIWITCAACSFTPMYPAINDMTSKDHHSRQSIRADDKPNLVYSINPEILKILWSGHYIASLISSI